MPEKEWADSTCTITECGDPQHLQLQQGHELMFPNLENGNQIAVNEEPSTWEVESYDGDKAQVSHNGITYRIVRATEQGIENVPTVYYTCTPEPNQPFSIKLPLLSLGATLGVGAGAAIGISLGLGVASTLLVTATTALVQAAVFIAASPSLSEAGDPGTTWTATEGSGGGGPSVQPRPSLDVAVS